MSFLAPAALVLGLLAIPILLLYMLRLRRREQTISSTLLWHELMLDQSANAPWQRLRRNLLLILQLLILAALVLALARPYLQAPGRIGGNVIVLLDGSASMMATDGDGGATRFEEAVAEVGHLIDNLDAGDQMTIISAGDSPVVLAGATSDRQSLRRALGDGAPKNTAADWPAAFALATGSSQGDSDPHIVIISDGGLPDSLPPLPGEVSFIPVGRNGENLVIAALGVRPAGDALNLLVTVANDGQTPAQALLTLFLNDDLYDSRRIDVAPGEKTSSSWNLPSDAGIVEARLETAEGTSDYLAIDNQAWRVVGRQGTHRVLLNTDGNLFLERFFSILPGYNVTRANDGNLNLETESGGTFDLYVFDGVTVPNPLPRGNILIFNPQPAEGADVIAPAIEVTGVFTDTSITRIADNPLLADVDWRAVTVAKASAIKMAGLEPLVEAEGGPLLLTGEIDGRRIAVFPFDLRRSDLPLQIAFPVIMANITAWLNPGRVLAADENLQPGSVVTLLPEPRADHITVVLPDGAEWEQSVESSATPILFDDTQQTGIYTVIFRDDSGEEYQGGRFAVNFFRPEESRIQPGMTLRIGQSEVVSGEGATRGRRELWPWLLLGGLLTMLVEWLIAYPRGNKPSFLRFR